MYVSVNKLNNPDGCQLKRQIRWMEKVIIKLSLYLTFVYHNDQYKHRHIYCPLIRQFNPLPLQQQGQFTISTEVRLLNTRL